MGPFAQVTQLGGNAGRHRATRPAISLCLLYPAERSLTVSEPDPGSESPNQRSVHGDRVWLMSHHS